MNTVKAFVEKGNDGTYSVYVDLEEKRLNYGIHGNGDSVKEAIEDFHSAYRAMKEFHKELGKKFVEAEFNIVYDVASFLNYYAGKFSLAGLGRITGINQRQLSHYVNGYTRPTKKTVEKIDDALHQLAGELIQVRLAV
ncbi:MAG: helix-turn-helix transcriptional regulator [Bacteroidales bacterium]|nr:helix-turn-helix transcriptional regulator [Bacteroidales bacterium]